MIVTERTKKKDDKFNQFGDVMPDGRLTMPPSGKLYRVREMVLLSKRLGRPLTSEEIKEFEI